MKILITGGTGFVGSFLTAHLTNENHKVTILARNEAEAQNITNNSSCILGDPTLPGSWQEKVMNYDAVINLAGSPIFTKWTAANKKIIRDSRINTTKNIVDAIDKNSSKEITILSTSAVGYYGFCGDEKLTEESPFGDDFLATVAREWEEEALKAQKKGVRVCITRFGIVLGPGGGMLAQVFPLFKKFLGGPMGNGRQWFSWIHIDDLVKAFSFLLKSPQLCGPFNFCSPNPVRNKDLAKAIGTTLHRPSFIPVPGFIVKSVLGEMSSVILKGQRVMPSCLLESGFNFKYPEINKAIADSINNTMKRS